ncbi:MAG: hypothetical protein EOO52_09835 [Gammaproteobacteria bacterium]|nr:MAG: hypothetical protein EOO52_09835 [Gammaproteobacteria bacterium]
MSHLWFFSETGRILNIPGTDAGVDERGMPAENMNYFEVEVKNADEFHSLCMTAERIILISSAKEFVEDFVAKIPTNIPRLAFIKCGTPCAAREQLDRLELDAYVLTTFADGSVDLALKKFAEEKHAIAAIQEELQNYSSIVFTAMSSASEMGVVAFYAQSVQNISDMNRLAQQTLRCLKDLSVQGYIQFSFEDKSYIYPENISKAYLSLLRQTQSSGCRILSQGRFFIFNFENAQFLITDAPVDDADKYGRLRDVIAHIVSIAEARAKTIMANEMLKAQQENTRTVITLLKMASQDNRTSVKTIMTELSLSLQEIATGLDLNLEQETAMLALSEHALTSLESLYETTDAIESHFRSLLLQLDQAAKLLESSEVEHKTETDMSVELF